MHQLPQFYNADVPYRKSFAQILGRDIKKVEKYTKMNLEDLFAATSE